MIVPLTSRSVDHAHCLHHAPTVRKHLANAELNGTVPLWQWIGDEGATTFSY
jgi:hypothetical protein